MEELAKRMCIPCQGGVPPLPVDEIFKFKAHLHPDWQLTHQNTRLCLDLRFENFAIPMQLGHKIGEMADEQWHHPDLLIAWGRLRVEVWTHKIDGLVESDFIFAAKVDDIVRPYLS